MMAIRKASEVVGAVRDADRMRYDRDRNEYAGRVVTADRLAIVARLRSLADGDMHYVKRMINEAADILTRDIHAASARKDEE